MLRTAVLGLVFGTFACGGTLQVLEHSSNAGAIAVAGSAESAHERADEYMREHCRGSYTLVDERPVGDGWQMAYRCEPRAGTGGAASPEARAETFIVTR